MYKIITHTGETYLTEKPNFIRKHENGCFVLTDEETAEGVAYSGTPYLFADGDVCIPFDSGVTIKTLTNNDKINSGTYTGTGLYGESNPNSVRPNIPAKVLMIIQNNETILTLSRTESTDEPFVWFASSAKEQCNENGLDYNWIAVS